MGVFWIGEEASFGLTFAQQLIFVLFLEGLHPASSLYCFSCRVSDAAAVAVARKWAESCFESIVSEKRTH